MEKAKQVRVIARLTDLGAVQPCPRCLNPQFEVVGTTSVSLDDEEREVRIPALLLACRKCGYLSYHAEGVLEHETR